MSIRKLLDHPARVALICAVVLAITLLLNGVLWRLWGLHRDYDHLTAQIQETLTTTQHLNAQLAQARDPNYIERQARDRLDMAGEHDLVFVFADE